MGLTPPDPPKGTAIFPLNFHVDKIYSFSVVRLANLMKVLTSDAIQDPTRVEARVRREVAMRRHTHEKTNAERKLTDEQRREKVEAKKVDEEKRGIVGAVFKYVCQISLLLVFCHSHFLSTAELKIFLMEHTDLKFGKMLNRIISQVFAYSILSLTSSTSRVPRNSSKVINALCCVV
jgi:hypothetical protein